jgi:hypothetical protein
MPRSKIRPSVNNATGTAPTGVGSGQDDRQSFSLFTIGGVDVRVWTPAELAYNTRANGNLAERAIGGAG